LTPVTAETFATWKANRLSKKDAEQETLRKAKQAQASAGKSVGMSGRDVSTPCLSMEDGTKLTGIFSSSITAIYVQPGFV
jgi:hypothetical protein